jgi:hypothetical protein
MYDRQRFVEKCASEREIRPGKNCLVLGKSLVTTQVDRLKVFRLKYSELRPSA